MTTSVTFPVKDAKKKDTGLVAEPTAQQLEGIAKTASDKALGTLKTEAGKFIQDTLGITSLDLTEVVPALRKTLRETEVDIVDEWQQTSGNAQIPGSSLVQKVHRYTVIVPDIDEKSVLNLGSGAGKHELPDAGITARTKSHVHLHAFDEVQASMIALGGPTASPNKISDPHSVLTSNQGIAAMTNGHLWAESKNVLNLASRMDQTILRSHTENVRVQADDASVEVGAKSKVAIGGIGGVNIVSSSDVKCGENAYGKGFKDDVVASSGKVAGKDLVTMLDTISASVTAVKAFKDKDWFYEKGKLSQAKKANDKGKLVVDAVKALSSIGRFVAGKFVGGQVKIAADHFVSMTGMLGASMYGHLSASVSSLLSASVVGGTASLKGLNWASVWAANGVSIRTVHGSASVRSEEGKVTLSAKDEIGISSRKGVNIGGDSYAELKSGDGPVFVASPKKTIVCAGEESGMGVILDGRTAYMGDVTNANEATGKSKRGTCIMVVPERENIYFKTAGCGVQLNKKKVDVSGKKINLG